MDELSNIKPSTCKFGWHLNGSIMGRITSELKALYYVGILLASCLRPGTTTQLSTCGSWRAFLKQEQIYRGLGGVKGPPDDTYIFIMPVPNWFHGLGSTLTVWFCVTVRRTLFLSSVAEINTQLCWDKATFIIKWFYLSELITMHISVLSYQVLS